MEDPMKKLISTVLALIILSFFSAANAEYADKKDIAALKNAVEKLSFIKENVQKSLEKAEYNTQKNEVLLEALKPIANLISGIALETKEENNSIEITKRNISMLKENAEFAQKNRETYEKLLRKVERDLVDLEITLEVREALFRLKSEIREGKLSSK